MQSGWQEQHSFQPHVPACGRGCPSHPLDVLSLASRSFLKCLQALLCALLSAPEASRALFLVLSLLAGVPSWVLKTALSLNSQFGLSTVCQPPPSFPFLTPQPGLSPGREVGQLQGSLRFVFCLSWGSLPFVALCPHCLENCCSTFFRGLFFRCIR